MPNTFASDNNATVHPKILEAIARVNTGHVPAYGDDPITARAIAKMREHFGLSAEVYFVFNGTGANVLSLAALTRPHEAILCANDAHIENDECGAPEKFTGCKLITVETPDGKLTPELLAPKIKGVGDQHHVQPRVISLTQATELGTVYSVAELTSLCTWAHGRGLSVHMDGARIANAAASLGVSLAAITRDVGVDVLSFGGTKNGLMFGEAVVFFRPELARDFAFARKQGMQLASKMRYVAAQFEALLTDDLWLENAQHANRLARRLAERVGAVPGLEIVQKTEANGVFARLPRAAIERLLKEHYFYAWKEDVVRWMVSFDSTEADIDSFAEAVKRVFHKITT